MIWRKWCVRLLVFSVLGAVAALGLAYQAWTNPAATRQQVLDTLTDRFTGATVGLESARLRLLGGIAFNDLRFARKDDPERQEFLYVPTGVIYLDKEHLLDGRIAIRKIEMRRPRLHIVRDKQGRLNLENIVGPVNLRERMPTIIIQQGTVLFEDQMLSAAAPVVEIKDVTLTIVNDPLPTLSLELTGQTDVAGKVRLRLKHDRATAATSGVLDLPGVPVNDALIQRVAALAPDVGNQLRFLRGDARLHATLDYDPATAPALRYDAQVEFSKTQFTHARLPLPLEDAAGTVRATNGRLPFIHLTAHSGPTNIDVTVHDLTPPLGAGDELPLPETCVGDLDLRVEHLQVTDQLLEQMPASVKMLEKPYSARGPLTVHHVVKREADGRWVKTWNLTAEGMRAQYQDFRYPVDRVTGSLDAVVTSDNNLDTKIDLHGFSDDRPVHLQGTVKGPGQAPEIKLEIWGDNIPLDQKVLNALPDDSHKLALQFLPDKSRQSAREFQPAGLGDFRVFINREAGGGDEDFKNRFLIRLHDACVKYDVFPYPLEDVTATIDILPDHWECRDGRGTHKGGEIRVSAQSYLVLEPPPPFPSTAKPTPAPPHQRVRVVLHGNQVLLDDPDFVAALNPRPTLQQTWKQLAIAGRMNFDATVVDEVGHPQNIDVGVTVQGCRMCPHFFPYPLEDVSGTVRYVQDSVYLTDLRARHGDSMLTLQQGRVILKSGGAGFQQVRLQGLKGNPIIADAALIQALPEGLQEGLENLCISPPVEVTTDLVIAQPPEPSTPLIVWWDGHADLKHAGLRAGVDVTDVSGQLSCCGLHNGKRLEKVVGTFLLTDATVLGQPFQDLHGRMEVLPDSPGILRCRDLSGHLFGGTLGGEARVEFGPVLHYDLYLKALDVQLERFGKHNVGQNADLQGSAMAALHLKGEGGDLAGLKGQGRLDVPAGKLYKLPPLLDLLKAFGLRVPDGIAFEQAHAQFEFDGPQLLIPQLDLYGNAISLRGRGSVNLNGSNLNMSFNADWGRMNQLFPDEVTKFSRAVSDQLLEIRMRGRVGDAKLERVFVPSLNAPAKTAGQTPPS